MLRGQGPNGTRHTKKCGGKKIKIKGQSLAVQHGQGRGRSFTEGFDGGTKHQLHSEADEAVGTLGTLSSQQPPPPQPGRRAATHHVIIAQRSMWPLTRSPGKSTSGVRQPMKQRDAEQLQAAQLHEKQLE